MVNAVSTVILTRGEAQLCVERIRAGIDGVRAEVLRLHEGEGWKALGYESWRECVTAEFGQSERHLYRLLTAAQIEREISPIGETDDCPIGQKSAPIPEGHLRELAPLKDQPDQMRAAYQAATEKNGGKPTAADIRQEVEAVLPPKPGAVEAYRPATPLGRSAQHYLDTAKSQETPAQKEQRLLAIVGDEDGNIARARLRQAASTAIHAAHNLWALKPDAVAGVIDEAGRMSIRQTIRDGRHWFDEMERAMARGVHIVKGETGD